MSLVDTVLWDSTDLRTVPSLHYGDLSGVLTTGGFRGRNRIIVGMPGQVSYVKPREAFAFGVPIGLGPEDGSGATPATIAARRIQFLANYAALQAIFTDNTGTFTRRLSKTLTPLYDDDTCDAEFLGFTITTQDSEDTLLGTLNFVNLDGAWT